MGIGHEPWSGVPAPTLFQGEGALVPLANSDFEGGKVAILLQELP